MELLLEKIARNTEPKTSFFIMVSDKSTHIKTKFNPLIQLDKTKKYEMGLVGLDTYYSFHTLTRQTTILGVLQIMEVHGLT